MTEQTPIQKKQEFLYFEDLTEGMQAEVSNLISEGNIVQFAQISGDDNPIHLDAAYAATTPFKTRIAHGSLCASFISAVVGTKLPGPGCVYVNQALRFKAPVRIGDVVVTKASISKLVPRKSFVELITQCFVNQVLVVDGEATLKVPNRPW